MSAGENSAGSGGPRSRGASRDRNEEAYGQIAKFLKEAGFGSLFDYYDVARNADNAVVESAIEARRRWAQTQQNNSKHSAEARWLIRHQSLLRMVLLERRDAYLKQVDKRRLGRDLEILSLFARGAMATGVLTEEAEKAVLAEGANRGIPEAYARKLVQKLVDDMGVTRQRSTAVGRDRSLAEALMSTVRETVAQGSLTAAEVNQLLLKGKQRGLDEQALRALLLQTAETAARSRGMAARRPDNALDAQLRSEAIQEIVDTVRGALLQGILNMSTVRSIQRRGRQRGLDARTVELLVAEARSAGERAISGELDPYAIFNVAPPIQHGELREAYRSMRQWALGLPSPAESSRACVVLDMAWTLVRTPNMQARYDARRAS